MTNENERPPEVDFPRAAKDNDDGTCCKSENSGGIADIQQLNGFRIAADLERNGFHPDGKCLEPERKREWAEYLQANRKRQPLPCNPSSWPKWQMRQGLESLGLNGAQTAVMLCLIDYASHNRGACWPGLDLIAGRTRRPEKTVRRAIKSLEDLGLVTVIERGSLCAYLVNWRKLREGFVYLKDYQTAHARTRRRTKVSKADTQPEQNCPETTTTQGQKAVVIPLFGSK